MKDKLFIILQTNISIIYMPAVMLKLKKTISKDKPHTYVKVLIYQKDTIRVCSCKYKSTVYWSR